MSIDEIDHTSQIGILNSQNSGEISAHISSGGARNAGGLIGRVMAPNYEASDPLQFEPHKLHITNSHNFANIQRSTYSGGLIGDIIKANFGQNIDSLEVHIKQSSNIGLEMTDNKLEETSNAGGILGSLKYGKIFIEDSFSKSKISAVQRQGGMIGHIEGAVDGMHIKNSYSASEFVNSLTSQGGLIPTNSINISGNYTVENSYWDKSLSRTEDSYQDKGEGRTTAEMLNPNNFSSWDFISIWDQTSGSYPSLKLSP